MTKIVFIAHNGSERVIEAEDGKTVMQAAVDNLIPGIVGDCGGCCTCATCHAYVDERWQGKLKPPSEDEAMMLEGALEVKANSRLTCQIQIGPELDGLILRTPERQF
ncbi:ferredoxin, 2Fe-2S [Solimonas aquatica]|uniref:Ferredoxin, 2Fe-2S n=1 Tax=Solimonas aquatica TaxID=489703 RepID=A0A1H9DIQ6_9GAMM|nr:2Fe-2S iron-sulfur cluster-binding protein [Solimonas aquatica]SEQ13271.1 ferredoxin, 2Fe-2S [Solimonas aquatica]